VNAQAGLLDHRVWPDPADQSLAAVESSRILQQHLKQ
jgi:hypothetical protein